MFDENDDQTVTLRNFPQTSRNADTSGLDVNNRSQMTTPVQQPIQPYTQVAQTPNKEKLYEELFQKIIREKDPKAALHRTIMQDQKTFDLYKDGVRKIEDKIDTERQRQLRQANQQTTNRLMGYQKERENKEQYQKVANQQKRENDEMKECSFTPQIGRHPSTTRARVGSNLKGRRNSRSPA